MSGGVELINVPCGERKSLETIFGRKNLALILTKQLVLRGLPAAMDDASQLSQPAGVASFVGQVYVPAVARDLVVEVVRNQLEEHMIGRVGKERAAPYMYRVTKHAPQDAANLGRLQAAKTSVYTCLRGEALVYTSIWAVYGAEIIGKHLWKAYDDKKRLDEGDSKSGHHLDVSPRKSLAADLWEFTWQNWVSLALEAVCAGVGTLVAPGAGTMVGQLVGGVIIYVM
jgi:hypothetical protein